MQALDTRPLILNVEDNDLVRTAQSELLRREGFDVLEALSGEEALLRLDCKPDVILLDVNLGPGMDGLEVCRRVKADLNTAAIPLILVSSLRISGEDRVQGLECGADGYLTKPVDPGELVAHIKALLRLRRAEKAHRQSEKWLQAAFEYAAVGMAIADLDGRYRKVNKTFGHITGFSHEELLPADFQSITPDDWLQKSQEVRGLLSGDIPEFVIEKCYVRKDGGIVWVKHSVSLLRDDDGQPMHLMVLAEDITDLKHAEEACRLSENRLRAIVEKSFDCINLIAADGTILYTSPSSVSVLGYAPKENMGRNAFELLHPDDLQQVREQLKRLIHNPGSSETSVHRGLHKDGSWRWLEARSTNLLHEPSVQALVINFRDITEQRQAQRTKEELLALLNTLLNKAPIGFAFISRDFRFLRVNEALAAMSGISAANHLGCTVQEVMPGLWSTLEPVCRRILAEDTPQLNHELVGETLATPGKARHWLLSGYPVRLRDECFGVGLIVNDVTECRNLEEQLQQAQKMEAIGRLASGVAHDFNNLLCIINGYSEILFQHANCDDQTREMLSEIKKAGELSTSLARQLLVFSRRQVRAPKLLDLNAVILNIAKMLRRVIGEDVRLVTKLAPGLGSIEADPGQIEQVMMNLAVNARDAMPAGGTLTIETAAGPTDRCVLLSVRDTGCGMTAEVKPHLFEPFFTTKEEGKGTGLGLATVYGIVKQSGGHIEVESEPGRGTQFRILLPCAEQVPSPQVGEQLPPRGSETVLVVEDEDAVRLLAARVLRFAGYQVLLASDGESALRVSAGYDGVIDLLVTDVVLPGLAGRQIVEKILQRRSEMRVLYMSGYIGDAIVRQGVLHNKMNFLQKPFTPVGLLQKVREVLDVPRGSAHETSFQSSPS